MNIGGTVKSRATGVDRAPRKGLQAVASARRPYVPYGPRGKVASCPRIR